MTGELKLDKDAMRGLEYRQLGEYSAVFHLGQNGKGVGLEMRTVEGNRTIWTHMFKDGTNFFSIPIVYVGNGLVALLYDPDSAKRQMKVDPMLRDAVPHSDKEARTTAVVEILSLGTGETKTAVPVTVSANHAGVLGRLFWRPEVEIAGDRLLISENNRITSYSLTDRKEVGVIFGNSPVAHTGRNLLANRNDRWHVILRDLTTLEKKDEFGFASPVALIRFSPDASKLYVLTQDQTFFILSTGGSASPAVKTAMQEPGK